MPNFMHDPQQSRNPLSTAGAWRLAPRTALALRPRVSGRLQAVHGRLWVTRGTGDGGTPDASGDQVLQAGDGLTLQRGERVVIEPLPPGAGGPAAGAWLRWDVLPPAAATAGQPWRETVGVTLLQPLADLRHAFALGAGAAVRLLGGLGRLAGAALAAGFAAGRRRWVDRPAPRAASAA